MSRIPMMFLAVSGGFLLVVAIGLFVTELLRIARPDEVFDWPEFVVKCVVFTVIGAIGVASMFAASHADPSRHKLGAGDARRDSNRNELYCHSCGDNDIVRGSRRAGRLKNKRTARCLSCGARGEVTRSEWDALPEANPGDPFETDQDRMELASRAPLTAGGVVLFLFLFALSTTLGVLCGIAFKDVLPFQDPVTTCAAMGLCITTFLWTRLAMPKRRPGRRCVNCACDLRDCPGDECPECGTPFNPEVVRGGDKHCDGNEAGCNAETTWNDAAPPRHDWEP